MLVRTELCTYWLERWLCWFLVCEGFSGPSASLARPAIYQVYPQVVDHPAVKIQLLIPRRRVRPWKVTGAQGETQRVKHIVHRRENSTANNCLSGDTEEENMSLLISHNKPKLMWVTEASPLTSGMMMASSSVSCHGTNSIVDEEITVSSEYFWLWAVFLQWAGLNTTFTNFKILRGRREYTPQRKKRHTKIFF